MPSVRDVAESIGASVDEVKAAYSRLYQRRLLVLEPDGVSVRMAPPFSGVPTQHRVRVGEIEYFANCAWDALGIPAALHRPGQVTSRCEQTHEPLLIRVDKSGPSRSPASSTLPFPPRTGGGTSSSPEARCSSSGRKNESINGARPESCRDGR